MKENKMLQTEKDKIRGFLDAILYSVDGNCSKFGISAISTNYKITKKTAQEIWDGLIRPKKSDTILSLETRIKNLERQQKDDVDEINRKNHLIHLMKSLIHLLTA